MIQYNSGGLLQFYLLLKKVFQFLLTKGLEGVKVAKKFMLKCFQNSKKFGRRLVEEYLATDSEKWSQEQLERQMRWLGRIIYLILFCVALDVTRKVIRAYKY